MLSKCANPGCEAKFRYLNEGKVFVADWIGGKQDNGDTCWKRTEMFWLCSICCKKFVLTRNGSTIVPVKLGLVPNPGTYLLREVRISS
jgi:hypothetical protein